MEACCHGNLGLGLPFLSVDRVQESMVFLILKNHLILSKSKMTMGCLLKVVVPRSEYLTI